jgi:hypothetical protein
MIKKQPEDIEKHELFNLTDDPEKVNKLWLSRLKTEEKEKQTEAINKESINYKDVFSKERDFIAGYLRIKSSKEINSVLQTALKNMMSEIEDTITDHRGKAMPSPWVVHEFVKITVQDIRRKDSKNI